MKIERIIGPLVWRAWLLGGGALLSCTVARAESAPDPVAPYVSVNVLSSRVQNDCAGYTSCAHRRLGGSLRAGASLPAWARLDLGVVKVDGVELAYTTLGSVRAERTVRTQVFVNGPAPVMANVTQQLDLSVSALVLDAVARVPLAEDLQLRVRAGLAATAATVKYTRNGGTMGSVTENHLKPHVGLDVRWQALPQLALSSGWEYTRYSTNGLSGGVGAWHLGLVASY